VGLREQLSLSDDSTNALLYETLRQATLTTDCIASSGLNFPYRTYYELSWDGACTTPGYFGQGIQPCPDESCDPGPTDEAADPNCGLTRSWVCPFIPFYSPVC
jgi:hypothetical protein